MTLTRIKSQQSLIDYSSQLTNEYEKNSELAHRKKFGQFFTHEKVAKFMVSFIKIDSNLNSKELINVLDPGSGVGIFASAILEHLFFKGIKKSIKFTLYEIDKNLLPYLDANMKACKKRANENGFKIEYKILNKDFIQTNTYMLNNSENYNPSYDLIITNPPYFKINRSSPHVKNLTTYINRSNIYPLFMAFSAKMLKENGQIIVLTPRSYCSGFYFKQFRNWFLNRIKPTNIHIFESRTALFKKSGVLQENVVLVGKKQSEKSCSVSISHSYGIPVGEVDINEYSYDDIVFKKNGDMIIRIPYQDIHQKIASSLDELEYCFNSLGFKVSTGPVVPFRVKEFLIDDKRLRKGFSPLFWMYNIINSEVIWNNIEHGKPTQIKITEKTNKTLVKNKDYIMIKRFSAKEQTNRIYAGIFQKIPNIEFIGIENHVNFIDKLKGDFLENELLGLVSILNSKLYNIYFQLISGTTQVNATELRNLPLPSMEKILTIGSKTRELKIKNSKEREKIISNTLELDKSIIKKLEDI